MKKFNKLLIMFVISIMLYLPKVNALTLEEAAAQIAPNDTIIINAIEPNNGMEFDFFLGTVYNEVGERYREEYGINASVYYEGGSFDTCKLSLSIQGPNDPLPLERLEKDITIVWQGGNSEIKDKIDSYLPGFEPLLTPNEWGGFEPYYVRLYDLNLINYYATANTKDLSDEVVSRTLAYSDTIKTIFNNTNFTYEIDFRAGSLYSQFETSAFGGLIVKFNDVMYGVQNGIGVEIKEILYVPSNTELTDNALIKAAEDRIKAYMPNLDIEITPSTYFRDYESAEGGLVDFGSFIDLTKTTDRTYNFKFKEFNVDFVIVADSSKMTNPEFLTKDVTTNVEVSSDVTSIPLDTKVEANKLTSGTTYNNIIKLIGVEDNETYDINLYSNTLNENITKLDDGNFEVRIPIPNNLKGKTLFAYYVDKNNKVIPYEARIDGDYAVFKTNHFSIYTIAEALDNPKTYDGVVVYFILGFTSLIMLVGILFGYKKLNKND